MNAVITNDIFGRADSVRRGCWPLLRWEVISTHTVSYVRVRSGPWRHLDLESFWPTSKLCQPDEWPDNVDDMGRRDCRGKYWGGGNAPLKPRCPVSDAESGRIETPKAPSGWGMKGVSPPQPTKGFGEQRELSSRVWGRVPAENAFWRILKATERSFLHLYASICFEFVEQCFMTHNLF